MNYCLQDKQLVDKNLGVSGFQIEAEECEARVIEDKYFAKPEDVGLVPEEESNDEEPSDDENDSGDEAPAAGSEDESMDVDPVNQ
ncbi:hypothetical protein Tco_0535401 [Tanacetum coccineum]